MPAYSFGLTLIALYFALILILSGFRSRYIKSHRIYLLRAFLPSWRFFEDIGEVATLYYRTASKADELGQWMPCLNKSKRRWSGIFINPEGGFLLASGSLIQHLVSDIEDSDEEGLKNFDGVISYQLTKNLVEHQIRENPKWFNTQYFQFKVCTKECKGLESSQEDLLISPVYEIKK